jgi:hypothetical protein
VLFRHTGRESDVVVVVLSAGTVVTVTSGWGEVVDDAGSPFDRVVLVVAAAPWGADEVVVSGADVTVVDDGTGAGCTAPWSVVTRTDGPESSPRDSATPPPRTASTSATVPLSAARRRRRRTVARVRIPRSSSRERWGSGGRGVGDKAVHLPEGRAQR